jgi:hypothetical protein
LVQKGRRPALLIGVESITILPTLVIPMELASVELLFLGTERQLALQLLLHGISKKGAIMKIFPKDREVLYTERMPLRSKGGHLLFGGDVVIQYDPEHPVVEFGIDDTYIRLSPEEARVIANRLREAAKYANRSAA